MKNVVTCRQTPIPFSLSFLIRTSPTRSPTVTISFTSQKTSNLGLYSLFNSIIQAPPQPQVAETHDPETPPTSPQREAPPTPPETEAPPTPMPRMAPPPLLPREAPPVPLPRTVRPGYLPSDEFMASFDEHNPVSSSSDFFSPMSRKIRNWLYYFPLRVNS